MQRNQPFSISCFVLFLIVSVSLADEFFWDQTNDNYQPDIYRDIVTFSPFGQEFTPNLGYLEVVQLTISNFLPDPAEIVISIHSDSISGPILGMSNTVTIPGYYSGLATFLFTAVSVEPGNLYVIEFVRNLGNAGVGGYSPATYPQGCAVLWGVPYGGIDLWFREGLWEESALQRFTWGSIKRLDFGNSRVENR